MARTASRKMSKRSSKRSPKRVMRRKTSKRSAKPMKRQATECSAIPVKDCNTLFCHSKKAPGRRSRICVRRSGAKKGTAIGQDESF